MQSRVRVIAFLFCAGSGGLCIAGPTAPNLPGKWSLSFDEEFNSPLNSSRWVEPLWGQTNPPSESEVYTPGGVSVQNGKLSLTATKTQQPVSGKNWTSGRIDTGPILGQKPTGYSFLYGYVEGSMKLVAGQGLWPAFWMLTDPNPAGVYKDVANGEIDIMEELGKQPQVDQVHYLQGGGNLGTGVSTGVDLSQGFHTYAVNWQPGKIDYYFDGKLVWSVNQSPTLPMYMILNFAVGKSGTWAGGPTSATPTTSTMQVDYVHVFQSVPEPASAWLVVGWLTQTICRRPRRRPIITTSMC